MYKVIVVDDERRTRIGITTIIDWKQSGFKIVDTAANGFDALTKYEEHIPDLFIVDIKMPGMNGMELVERLKEKNKHIKIIFLSGFAEFEYAQQAIRFQAAGYLLKPLEEGELMKLLAKVKGELDKERQVSQTIKWKVEEENNRLIATTLKGTITEESKQFFQYHLDWNRYTLLLIKIANLHEVDTTSVVHELRLICNEEGIVFHCEGNYGLMTNYELTSRRWTELCRKVKNIMDKSGLIFCCAISTSANTIQDIPKSYQEAVYLLEDSFYYEKEFITIDTSSWCERKMDHSHSVGFMKDKLAYATELSDKGSISKTVEEMIILYAKQRVSSTVVKKQISQMLLEITDRLSDMYPGVKCQFKRNQ